MVTTEFRENLENGDTTPDALITVAEPADENPDIPAGYTYLGQFIDHDITFDPASSLQQFNDPDALEDFRSHDWISTACMAADLRISPTCIRSRVEQSSFSAMTEAFMA